MQLEPLGDKWKSFGWEVFHTDGHDLEGLLASFNSIFSVRGKPSVIIAHTVKGKGVSFVEADYTFHGRALTQEQAELARREIEQDNLR